jgi:hypothetical protein
MSSFRSIVTVCLCALGLVAAGLAAGAPLMMP